MQSTGTVAYENTVVGAHEFRVRATDASGNIDESPEKDTWTVYHTPLENGAFDNGACPAGAPVANPTDDQNLAAFFADIATGTADDPREVCLRDGTYSSPDTVPVKSHMRVIGLYSDGSRPTIVNTKPDSEGDAGSNVVAMSGATLAWVEGVTVTGAKHNDACEPDCGSGFRGGSRGNESWNVRATENQNSGAGGMGADAEFHHVEMDNNGNVDSAAGKVSAAGIKSANDYSVYNSYVHDNYWSGVWCDEWCENSAKGTKGTASLEVHDSRFVDNGKAGVHLEITTGHPAVIEGSSFSGNGRGHPDWPTDSYESTPKAGVVLSGAGPVVVGCPNSGCTDGQSGNDFGSAASGASNAGIAVYSKVDTGGGSSGPRNPYPEDVSVTYPAGHWYWPDGHTFPLAVIDINGNHLGGDANKGCGLNGAVFCPVSGALANTP